MELIESFGAALGNHLPRKLAESDGRSDKKVPFSDPSGFKAGQLIYKEYTFTANDLPVFQNYRIKFVLTSNSQTYVPRVSDLRVLTLA